MARIMPASPLAHKFLLAFTTNDPVHHFLYPFSYPSTLITTYRFNSTTPVSPNDY
ncbi:hypothetical protein PGT21_010664 [Puccinia graminis f. sp. tritici]|uniref:Uncharacterized protein n=1 Tax=Puccinia graminis f. sp. tritici TaxID=56615 RepID=A0A5B0PC40_PUCGR|nr:hypothetical protein PGT21_010664 [Puccinia graminis f. sp. tritici]KAA1099135.1 hypothetical protein PGTUg99_024350 [Puccinia graminis f. sp. tritici]